VDALLAVSAHFKANQQKQNKRMRRMKANPFWNFVLTSVCLMVTQWTVSKANQKGRSLSLIVVLVQRFKSLFFVTRSGKPFLCFRSQFVANIQAALLHSRIFVRSLEFVHFAVAFGEKADRKRRFFQV
jgi:hypothetical protein